MIALGLILSVMGFVRTAQGSSVGLFFFIVGIFLALWEHL